MYHSALWSALLFEASYCLVGTVLEKGIHNIRCFYLQLSVPGDPPDYVHTCDWRSIICVCDRLTAPDELYGPGHPAPGQAGRGSRH